jgi:hypothetical protein
LRKELWNRSEVPFPTPGYQVIAVVDNVKRRPALQL